jgi:uncharacterized membrane protein YgcG
MAQASGIEVSISGNPAGLERALGKAQSSLSRFAKGAAASLGGALSVGAFVAASKAAINYADSIDEMAEKVGIAAEELSALTYAAKVNGVSTEQLQTGLTMLIRSMGEGAEKFDALGVSIYDSNGQLRSANDVLVDVAEKFSVMEEGVGKSQWALELFGRSGLNLIPILNLGAQGLADATEQARLFGLVVSGETAKSAANFNDNLVRLQQYVLGATTSFATGMLPALEGITSALINSASSTDSFKSAGEAAGRILEGMARAVIVVKDNLSLLGDVIKGLGIVLFTRYMFGAAAGFVAFAKAVKAATITMTAFNAAKKIGLVGFITLAAGIAIATDSVDELKRGLDFVYQTAQDMVPGMAELGKQISDAVGIDLSGLSADLSAARKLVEEGNAGAGLNIPVIPGKGGSGDKKDGFSDNPSQEPGSFFTDRLEMIRDQFMSEREVLEEEYALNQAVLDNALMNKALKEQEYYDLSRQLAEQHASDLAAIQQASISQQLSDLGSGLGSMAAAFQNGGKKMLKVSKAFAAAQAIVATIQAAVDAMKNPLLVDPASKFAAYAAVFAKGMSAVAAIRGVSESGGGGRGGGGGSGGGRGGGGGMSGGGAPAAASPTTTFQFTMMNDPMGFGEKFARQFIDQLNSTQRNGGTIRGVIA